MKDVRTETLDRLNCHPLRFWTPFVGEHSLGWGERRCGDPFWWPWWCWAVAVSQLNSHATAQEPEQAPAKLIRLDLDDLVSVEPARQDAPAVILTVPVDETRTRTVVITKTRNEQRTRVVNVDGKQVEQNYVVAVPYTEQVEQVYTVRVPQASRVPADKILGYDLLGKEVDPQELIDRLSNRAVVFMLNQPWPKGAQVDPQQRVVLRDDVILLHVPTAGKNMPRDKAAPQRRRSPATVKDFLRGE